MTLIVLDLVQSALEPAHAPIDLLHAPIDPVQSAAVQVEGLLQFLKPVAVAMEDTRCAGLILLNPRHQLVQVIEIMADLADLVREVRLRRHPRERSPSGHPLADDPERGRRIIVPRIATRAPPWPGRHGERFRFVFWPRGIAYSSTVTARHGS